MQGGHAARLLHLSHPRHDTSNGTIEYLLAVVGGGEPGVFA